MRKRGFVGGGEKGGAAWRPKGSQLWRYAVGVLTVPAASGAGVAKLGCSDRAQAVAVAFHRGIISLE